MTSLTVLHHTVTYLTYEPSIIRSMDYTCSYVSRLAGVYKLTQLQNWKNSIQKLQFPSKFSDKLQIKKKKKKENMLAV